MSSLDALAQKLAWPTAEKPLLPIVKMGRTGLYGQNWWVPKTSDHPLGNGNGKANGRG